MEQDYRTTSVSPSEKTIPMDRDRTLVAPRFDDKSIQRARPAVPLTRRAAKSVWPSMLLVACIVGGLIGGMAGGLGFALYQRRNNANEPRSAASVNDPAPAVGVADTEEPPAATRNESEEAGLSPSDMVQTPASAAPVEEMRRAQPEPLENVAEVVRVGDGGEQAALRGALEEWVAATNSRDIQRQMKFYGPTVNAFYRTRNVPREAVRAEKSRVFGGADAIDISAGTPNIRFSRDGQTATMRFRKKYAIEGGGEDRRGEVVQELRWRRTAEGWKIISERDVRVIH